MRPHLATLGIASALALAGCGDDPAPTPPPAAPNPSTPANATATAPGTTPSAANNAGRDPPPPPMTITDPTFVESVLVRDPFRSFAADFINTSATGITRTVDVKLPNFSIDDLRLVAIIVGTDSPYAMVVDPTRTGTILRRGMYVGRHEIIHSTVEGSQDYAVNWRVARINPVRVRRAADSTIEEVPANVVFERPDPLNPNAQIVERMISLAPAQSAPGLPGANPPAPNPALGALGPRGQGSPYLPSSLGGNAPPPGNAAPGTTQVYNYTIPPAPAPPPAPTTVVVQAPPPQPAPSSGPPPVIISPGPPVPAMPFHGTSAQ